MSATNHDPFALARDDDPLEVLRRDAEALAAEYRAPLPDEGDERIVAALERWRALEPQKTLLARRPEVTVKTEERILMPTAYAAEQEVVDFITDWLPDGLLGMLAQLHWALESQPFDPVIDREVAEAFVAIIEREIGRSTHNPSGCRL
jgi:hypothetical protein